MTPTDVHLRTPAEQRRIAGAAEEYNRAWHELDYLRRYWGAQSGMLWYSRTRAEAEVRAAEERLRQATHDLAIARGDHVPPPAPILPIPRRPQPEGEGRAA